MPDDAPDKKPNGHLAPSGVMGHDRPLDALLPELRLGATVPKTAVHPRVLEVDVEGRYEWVFAVWSDPGDPRVLHREVKRLVEATLLAELSQPAAELRRETREFHWLRLVLFAPVQGADAALAAFGFTRAEYVTEQYLARMAALTNEGEAMGWDVPERPAAVYEARIGHVTGAFGERLRELQRLMAEKMGADVWGRTPGAPSRLFANYAQPLLGERLRPTPEGLRAFETLVVQQEPGVIRWIPPLLFQALADFIGVVAQAHYALPVGWAECALEPSGFAPPPLLRVERGGQAVHVPIGLHLLRWCVMPLAPKEEVPSLAVWAEDQFGRTEAR